MVCNGSIEEARRVFGDVLDRMGAGGLLAACGEEEVPDRREENDQVQVVTRATKGRSLGECVRVVDLSEIGDVSVGDFRGSHRVVAVVLSKLVTSLPKFFFTAAID
jgi:hypothetical protein